MPRRANKGNDPLLDTKWWKVTVRNHWVRKQQPCARCGGPIDYGAHRYYPGTRRVNPRSLVVGHVVGRDQARRLGWTDEQIMRITNTQPECNACSSKSGATYGNKTRSKPRPPTSKTAINITNW